MRPTDPLLQHPPGALHPLLAGAKTTKALAARIRAVLDDSSLWLRAGGIPARPVDLASLIPAFPGAIVVADGLDAPCEGALAQTLDRDAFLATGVLKMERGALSVAEVLALAAASRSAGGSDPSPALDACVRAVARTVSNWLRAEGADAVEPAAGLITHHTVGDGATIFVPKDAALHTLDVDASLQGGLTWAAAVQLVPPSPPRHVVVYEVGDVDPSAPLFSVCIASDGRLKVLCRGGSGPLLEVSAAVDAVFKRFATVVVTARFRPFSRLRLWVDDVLVGSARAGASDIERLTGRQAVGSGILGRHRSAIFYRELMLVDRPVNTGARARLTRHLERRIAHEDGARARASERAPSH